MKRFCNGLALVGLCAMMMCAHADMLSAPVVVGIADMCMATNSVSVQTTYAAAFARAGNTPLVLPAETNRAVVARMLASVDVLLLCGGEDVEPSRYKTKPSPRLEEVNLRRDAWEWLLLDEAVKRRLPVIGICRGCQLISRISPRSARARSCIAAREPTTTSRSSPVRVSRVASV